MMLKSLRLFSHTSFAAGFLLAASGLLLSACSDDDLANETNNGTKEGIAFAVADVQNMSEANRAATRSMGSTTVIQPQETGVSTLQCEENGDYCFIESTVEGVNPVKGGQAVTRAALKTTIDADFGCWAYKNSSTTPDYFYNEKVNSTGTMYAPKSWTTNATTLKFYAVYPYMDGSSANEQLSAATHAGAPYVDFTANTTVANQHDLMTASTAALTKTGTGSHVVPLTFNHALTAVKVAVGSALPAGKTINKVEISGVYGSGRYDLGTGTWSNHAGTKSYTVSGLSFSTTAAVNTEITGGVNTFLMIPQTCPTGAKLVVTFSDGSTISASLAGKTWTPGTTKTYKISNSTTLSGWVLTVTPPVTLGYTDTSAPFGITSYRQNGATQTPIGWQIVGYDANGDGNYAMSEKPAWLTGMSATTGAGGSAAESVTATIDAESYIIGDKHLRNNALSTAATRGTASAPYDLSTHSIKGAVTAQNTANCYVISAPGHYSLPLVYGNAIKNGATNTSAYISSVTTPVLDSWGHDNVLHHFVDHADQPITSPYIALTNGGANIPATASLVWADEAGLVQNLSIEGSGANARLKFEAPQTNIKQGNAVVAVKDAAGKVLWSWHLWFAPDNCMDVIPVTNHTGVVYNFSKEPLGWKVTSGTATTYGVPRSVSVKVKQTVGTQTATFTITQNNHDENIESEATIYAFSRKDPGPTGTVAEGTYNWSSFISMDNTIGYSITHPGDFMPAGNGVYENTSHAVVNLWSADWKDWNYNGLTDDPVVKTIYDPSPAGYHLPAHGAFSGFTTTGQDAFTASDLNIEGADIKGLRFYTDATKSNSIFFAGNKTMPNYGGGMQPDLYGSTVSRWSAFGFSSVNNGFALNAGIGSIIFDGANFGAHMRAVQPVAE